MARRLSSFMVRMKGGPTLGGSGTQMRIYDDEALTTLSTLYQRSSGASTQPNPITPNAGKQTQLRVAAAAGDTVLAVVSIASFAVGDLVPIYDGTNTSFRVITALNAVGPTMTVDQTVGFAFATANTLINRPSMRGHTWFWVDDVRDYFFQPKDVGSTELMPPLALPTRVPTGSLNFQKDDVSVAAEATLDVRQMFDVVDEPGVPRMRFEFRDYWADSDGATITMDFNKGAKHKVVLGASGRIIAFSNLKAGGMYVIRLAQDGTGSRTMPTWPASVRWPGAAIPILTTAANKSDYFGFIYDGTNMDCVAVTQNV